MTAIRHRRLLPQRQGRSVPAVYGLVTIVLVAGAVALALSTPPPSTPPLAAVAPAPQEQVEVERIEQDSRFGDGTGGHGDCDPSAPGCTGGGTTEPASQDHGREPSTPPSEVIETQAPAELRRCVHGPGGPRQTEDPQSPPCKREVFTGDNGGATSHGVTTTAIRVAVPLQGAMRWAYEDLGEALVSHFNRLYEFYGRRIELVPIELPDGDHSDPAVQRAAASDVAAADVFASLEYPGFGTYQATLAERQIVSFTGGIWNGIVREADVSRLDPYVWATFTSFEDVQAVAGQAICRELAGRPARHSGESIRTQTRRFGLIVQGAGRPGGSGFGPELLVSQLEACEVDFHQYGHAEESSDIELLVQRLRDDGITTVVCACREFSKAGDYFAAADAGGYEPEWFLAGPKVDHLHTGNRTAPNGYSPQQMAHVFGVDVHLRRLPKTGTRGGRDYTEHYWYHAARDENPNLALQRSATVYYELYGQLLILASGVQGAGPELTPTNLADALKRTVFPNPGVGMAPWFQPSVGFGPADHSFNSDVALYWWRSADETERTSRTDFGEMCYVADGARFTADTIPADADELFFDPEAGCR